MLGRVVGLGVVAIVGFLLVAEEPSFTPLINGGRVGVGLYGTLGRGEHVLNVCGASGPLVGGLYGPCPGFRVGLWNGLSLVATVVARSGF